MVTLIKGISAGKILIEYIDTKCELGAVFADLIQLRSIENAPFWLVTATGKIMGRCLARPNAVLALVNGVLISDRVKLRHEVVVSLGNVSFNFVRQVIFLQQTTIVTNFQYPIASFD